MTPEPADLIQMGIEDKHPQLTGKVSVEHDPKPRGKGQHHFRAAERGGRIKVAFFVPLRHPDFARLVRRAGRACAEIDSGATNAEEVRLRA